MIMNAVIFTMAVLLLCDSSSAQRIEPNKVYATAWPACDSGSAFDIKAANQAASSKPCSSKALAVAIAVAGAILKCISTGAACHWMRSVKNFTTESVSISYNFLQRKVILLQVIAACHYVVQRTNLQCCCVLQTHAGQPSNDEMLANVAATKEAVRAAKEKLQAALRDPVAAWAEHCAQYGPHMLQDTTRYTVSLPA